MFLICPHCNSEIEVEAEAEGKEVLRGLDQIAAFLQLTPNTLSSMLEAGEIKLKRVRKAYIATKDQLKQFVETVET